jgi:hypothetical protein
VAVFNRPLSTEDYKALTLRLYGAISEVFRTGNIDLLDELLAPDMVDLAPSSHPVIRCSSTETHTETCTNSSVVEVRRACVRAQSMKTALQMQCIAPDGALGDWSGYS